jgi:hypothetical protein
MDVFYDILDENPAYRDRINRKRRPLEPWERLQSINGTTLSRFRKIVSECPWSGRRYVPLPMGLNGKLSGRYPFIKGLLCISWVAARLPILEEACNNRIVYILTK